LPRRALYPGSFDPPTNGHLDIIARACKLFDEVVVALLVNPNKQPLFNIAERIALLTALLDGLPVKIATFSGLLVDFARKQQADAIIRGLRSSADYEYELPMVLMNRHLYPEVETVFLIAAQGYTHISSSLVKEVFKLGGAIDGLVPPLVAERMQAKIKEQKSTQ
jgi:pantetheine-phosphate adenylyltransferase